MDGGRLPEKLFTSIDICSMAGSFDKSSKTAHGKNTFNDEITLPDYSLP
jgi:hypothetical protein